MAKSRKLTFDDDIVKEEQPKPFSEQLEEAKEQAVQAFEEKITKAEEPAAEFPSVFDTPMGEEKAEEPPMAEPEPAPMPEPEPVEEPKTIEDLAYTGPEPAGTSKIAQPLHDTKDILTAQMSQRAQEYYDNAMREQFGYGVQQTKDLRTQIAEILKPNPDEDMVKSLVHFEGFQPNYIVVSVQPILLKQAWDVYRQYERPVPGKFMEMVFDILNAQSRRYFHKVSIVELK